MSVERNEARDRRFDGIRIVAFLVAVMWIAEIVDTIAGHRLDQYGIEPRDPDGLVGVGAAPFLHADFGHLISNTLPFVVLGLLIAVGGAVQVIKVTAIVAVVGGLGTWLIAPDNTVHIGASGIVFGYASYLLTRGIFNRSVPELLIAGVLAAVWGTALLAGLLPQDGISWQGHLCGAIGGVVAASMLAPKREIRSTA